MKVRLSDLVLLALFASGGIIALYWGTRAWQGAAGLCVISIAFSVAVARHRLKHLAPGQVPDFLTVFLAFEVLNKFLTIVSLAAGPAYLKPFDASKLVAPVYAFRAELVFLAFLVLFTVGWHLVQRRFKHIGKPLYFTRARTLVPFYLVTMAAAIFLSRASSINVGALSSFIYFAALAAVGMLLLSDGPYGLRGKRWLLSVMLLAPLFFLGMISGTKSGMILVALPLLMAGLAHGTRRVAVTISLLAVFMLAVGIPLSEQMRAANWQSTGGTEHIGLRQGLNRVYSEYVAGNAPQFIASTFVQFCDRASSAQMGGVVMELVTRDGYIGTETIRTLPSIFIPRVLWPGKPSFSPGAWFTWYVGDARSPQTATSATAMMLGTEIYWMGGVLPFLFLSAALGALYAFVWRALSRIASSSLMGYAAMYALLGLAIRFEETNTLYAITQPIIYLVYAAIMAFADRRMRPVMRKLFAS